MSRSFYLNEKLLVMSSITWTMCSVIMMSGSPYFVRDIPWLLSSNLPKKLVVSLLSLVCKGFSHLSHFILCVPNLFVLKKKNVLLALYVRISEQIGNFLLSKTLTPLWRWISLPVLTVKAFTSLGLQFLIVADPVGSLLVFVFQQALHRTGLLINPALQHSLLFSLFAAFIFPLQNTKFIFPTFNQMKYVSVCFWCVQVHIPELQFRVNAGLQRTPHSLSVL